MHYKCLAYPDIPLPWKRDRDHVIARIAGSDSNDDAASSRSRDNFEMFGNRKESVGEDVRIMTFLLLAEGIDRWLDFKKAAAKYSAGIL